MSFLPKGYVAPKESSNYLKLIEGTIKFRVIGNAVIGFEYWTQDKKPVRLKNNPQEKPADIKLEDNGSYNIKHFWAFPVIDRNDLSGIKILELTQASVMRDLEAYLTNEDWGDVTEYDISITGTGKGMDRRYSTIASPHKPLNDKEKKMVEDNPVKLEALFYGENPFDKKWKQPSEETPDIDVAF
jgi:hypothetical protein